MRVIIKKIQFQIQILNTLSKNRLLKPYSALKNSENDQKNKITSTECNIMIKTFFFFLRSEIHKTDL